MTSHLFHATVDHVRFQPVRHEFSYPVYMYAIDLDDLEKLDKNFWFFGYNRFRPVSINDRDYLRKEHRGDIKNKLFQSLREMGHDVEDIVSVQLFTAARFFGYVFNPVSFFVCYRQNRSVKFLVAEVNNTFMEKHLYVLCEDEFTHADVRDAGGPVKVTKQKSFHVSPFNDMLGDYVFCFSVTEEEMSMQIEIQKGTETAFRGSIRGKLLPLTAKEMGRTLMRSPMTAWLTYPRILWQAARLYFGRRLRVYTRPHPQSEQTIVHVTPKLSERVSKKLFEKMLGQIHTGKLTVTYPDGEIETYCGKEQGTLHANLHIKNYRFFKKVVFGGDVGAGESFTLGDWESPDLTLLLKLFLLNRDRVDPRRTLLSAVARISNRMVHFLRRNHILQSKKNIEAHYDLSNDMFMSFLDPSMSYSCALFEGENDSLLQAQKNKIQRILTQAELESHHHVLEIGCGWGSLAIEAVKQYGCRFTCLTLSEEQQKYAKQRIAQEGLEDRIEVLLADYRTISTSYDRIISVEMIEAVGKEYLPEYFKACERLLVPGGRAVLQAITMPDERMDQYGKNCDWIQKYIFPGCFVPSLELLEREVAAHTDLKFEDVYQMRAQYERTLLEWCRAFRAQKERILELGFDMNFIRQWLYYFAYCEAGFSAGVLNTYQLVLSKEDEIGADAYVHPQPQMMQSSTSADSLM